MDSAFGQMLRQFRRAAGLTQEELGQHIHIHGSMISRFETGRSLPTISTVQDVINVLALHGRPREEVDQLLQQRWEQDGYTAAQVLEGPAADPIVGFIHREVAKLHPEQRSILSEDVRSIIEIDRALFSASKARADRRWESAGNALLSLRKQLEQRIQHWYLRVDQELGQCWYSAGRYAEAVQYHESALWSARQLGDPGKQAEILIKLGDAHRRRGGQHWDAAHDRYNAAKAILESLGDRLRVADCQRKIAGVYLLRGQPVEALPLCEESLSICQEQGADRGVCKALQHKGWAYDMLGRWGEATNSYEEAHHITERTASDDWEIVKSLRYLGDAYRLQRRIHEAEQTYEAALGILERYEDLGIDVKLVSGVLRLGLAKVYLKQRGRELEAKLCLNQSLEAHRGLEEDFRIAQILTEQGELLLKLGRFEDAEMRLWQASDRLERLGNTYYYAIALATLCELYYEKRDFKMLSQSAELARSVDNGLINSQLARVELAMGKALVDEERQPEAIEAFCMASDRALSFNEETFLEISQSVLNEIDRIARESGPEDALHLCAAYQAFWGGKEIVPSSQWLVKKLLDSIARKQEEIRMLEPIS